MEQVNHHGRNPGRDIRIDFWRGLCLIDMVLVHLAYEKVQFGTFLEPYICDYLRFAAGGFVCMAGMAVGYIYLPKARQPERRWQTYCRLWIRCLQLALWQFMVCLGWIILEVWRGSRPPNIGLGHLLLEVLSMREGGDLLPLYMILIALAPLLLETCRRRFGPPILFAVSICLFVVGRAYPYALALDPSGNFPPILWQLVFISGMLAGINLARYDKFQIRNKVFAALAAWAAFALLFWCEYWKNLGLPPCPVTLVFTKVPLTTGELLRYLSLVAGILTSTDLIWRWINNSAFVSFAAMLGKYTLQVYVAQIFLMELAGTAATTWWWYIGTWQILYAPICLGMLWLLAAALQWKRQREGARLDWSILLASPAPRQIGD